jgi:hypothetical protein
MDVEKAGGFNLKSIKGAHLKEIRIYGAAFLS